jgi:very-short-patch-repair endonuclease
VRVVIEVDGRHHYATQDLTLVDKFVASAQLYAEMAREDRRLRLMGYEVYRFGGHEFQDVNIGKRQIGLHSQKCVSDFFERLFVKHGIV